MTHRAILFLTTAMIALSGCVLYQGERYPDLVGQGLEVDLASAPRIEVVLEHRHTIDGADAGGMAVDASYPAVKESFERVKQEFPFLANAEIGMAKPDFVLEIRTEIAERGQANAFLTGLTLGIIPHFIRSNFDIAGSLSSTSGQSLGSYRAYGQLRGAIQILLIVALPALPFTNPGDEFFDDTFRNFFLQLGQDLEVEIEKS